MNPYGIQQVDVPGLLSIYQGTQDRRMQLMKARREEERQAQRDDIMGRIFTPKTGGQGGMSGAAAQFGGGSLVATPEQEAQTARMEGEFAGRAPAFADDRATAQAPQGLVDPSRLDPRTDGIQLNQDALRDLYRYDPQTAFQLQTSVYNANKQQLDQMQAYGEAGLGVVYRLKRLPQDQRAAELQASLPMLQSMGIDTSQLAQVDLSDHGLTRYEAVFGKLADLKPKLRNVGPGDMIIDEDRIGLPGDPTVYESPIVKGEDGVLYERNRPPAPQVGEVKKGYRFRGGDPADQNNWEPVSAASGAPSPPNTIARSAYQAWIRELGQAGADALLKRNGLSVGNY
ncbi:hypothetical protein [Sphingopyxis sp. JAI128]|uniref:hypothetical protein n=1 Tax=Sphingopyxis sp. JAI128 TaxID=2723066 RepID=UPI0016225599|nr:hypothetical protein [Sphingopyxis sp. JAI128]MBB6424937.1 hypothetical protein [Sphingopyxis sp. JAI128]